MTRENFNMIQNIVKYENGNLNQEEVVALFQTLIDSGYILSLQGTYHRTAKELIAEGLVQVR